MPDPTLDDQQAYYRERAPEYDDWFYRRGRYDRGEKWNALWEANCQTVREALRAFNPNGHVLELAAGTGIWTQVLARSATTLTALDASPETLAINRQKLATDPQAKAPVEYLIEDLFAWQPTARYDCIFFGFWLSHVPPEKFKTFWSLVQSALKPEGRIFFVDSRREQTSIAMDHQLPAEDSTISRRQLNDGRAFDIFKIYYQPRDLERRLRTLGWSIAVQETDTYFIHGSGVRTPV